MINSNRRQYLVLISAFIYVIAYHHFAYIGHFGYDDLNYAKIAHDLNTGTVDYNDHFSYRFPLVYLTALSYKFFGINDLASSLPPIGITFLILFIVFNILKKKPIGTLILGMGLTLLNQWFLFYSDKLMPDIYVALSVIFSLFIIYKYKYESDKSNPGRYAVLLSAGLLFGFVSKGTIILMIPLLLYIFAVDLFFKRDIKFWIYTALSGTLFFITYLLFIKHLTGNAMQRFDALLNNSYLNHCSYDRQSSLILFKRIGFEFYAMLIYTGMFTGVTIVISYFFRKNIIKVFRLDSPFTFFLVSTLLLFLSANFMSISITSYVPMCLDPRHYLYIVPVAAIPAAEIVFSFIVFKKQSAQLLILLFLLTLLSIFMEGSTFLGIYLPLFILFGFSYLLYKKIKNKMIFVMLFIVILMIYPMSIVKYAQEVKYTAQRDFINQYFKNTNDNINVISNDVQKRLGDYYLGFESTNKVTFLSYGNFEIDTLDRNKKIYLLVNPYTRFLSRISKNNLPFYAWDPEKFGILLIENKELKIKIYDLSGLSNSYSEANKLYYSFNGFELETEHWENNQIEASAQIIYEGHNSSIVSENSATFKYPLDSLDLLNIDEILITAKVQCFFTAPTKAKLVILTESENGNNTRQTVEINKFIKAYSNWWPVEFETTVGLCEIEQGIILKIYIWNPDKDESYIDNFEINIYKITQVSH